MHLIWYGNINRDFLTFQANELLLGGRKVTAIEACQLGLVSQVLWPTSMMQEVIPKIQNIALNSAKVTSVKTVFFLFYWVGDFCLIVIRDFLVIWRTCLINYYQKFIDIEYKFFFLFSGFKQKCSRNNVSSTKILLTLKALTILSCIWSTCRL